MPIMRRCYLILLAGNSLLFYFGLGIWRQIRLPYENPWGIHGPLTRDGINPFNDTLGFSILIIFAIIFNFLFAWTFAHSKAFSQSSIATRLGAEYKLKSASSGKAWVFSLFMFTLCASLLTVAYHSSGPYIDGFHEGESLGPAVDLIAGKIPYRDTIFLHGIIQDPYRAIAAFAIFGKSIAGTRIFTSIIQTCVAIFSMFFVIYYFRGKPLIATLTIIVINLLQIYWIQSIPFVIFLTRDVVTIAWLWCLCLAVRRRRDALWSLVGFIPFVALIYSTDRGIYLLIVALGVLALVCFAWDGRRARRRVGFFGCGAIFGFLLLRHVLGAGWGDYWKFVFVILPKYSELLFNSSYPLSEPKALAAVAIMYGITSCCALEFGKAYKSGGLALLRNWTADQLPQIELCAVSLVFFRSALGRSDLEHIFYGFFFAIVALFAVVVSNLPSAFINRIELLAPRFRGIMIILAFTCLVIPLRRGVFTDNFPIGRSDDSFLSGEVKATRNYLLARLGKDDNFVTLTNEAYWYYLLDRPCPLRFSSVWLAEPYPLQVQEAMTLSKNHSIKYVLAESGTWFEKIDGYQNRVRVPLIFASLDDQYVEDVHIGKHIIYRRKE